MKTYIKPELVVLCKTKSDEAVLVGCKVGAGGYGAGGFDYGCYFDIGWGCTTCSAIGVS